MTAGEGLCAEGVAVRERGGTVRVDAVRVATAGRGVQGRVVMMAKVNVLRELLSTGGEELSALIRLR